MPIDPYAALNAMLRAEAARFSPPARKEGQDRPRADRAPADRTVPQPATATRRARPRARFRGRAAAAGPARRFGSVAPDGTRRYR
ncbi:predicted protein [Streptomyces sp. C]|nr:predicted protein [Streptomyces sp. C]